MNRTQVPMYGSDANVGLIPFLAEHTLALVAAEYLPGVRILEDTGLIEREHGSPDGSILFSLTRAGVRYVQWVNSNNVSDQEV